MKPEETSTLGDMINEIAGSVTSGLIALAGVICLFALQQRAQRAERRRILLDNAAERMMETIETMRTTWSQEGQVPGQFNKMLVESWRFSWLLDKRDEPISRWAFGKLVEAGGEAIGKPIEERDQIYGSALVAIMTGLNEWRLGTKKPKWFEEDTSPLASPGA